MQRFVNQIRPTADQREKIRPMVNDAAESLRRLRRDTTHSTELILQNLEDQISVVLAPAQRDHFNDMIQRNREALQQYNQQLQQRQAGAAPAGAAAVAPATAPAGVNITGQVKNPGHFPLPGDAPLSVLDLVAKAGGLPPPRRPATWSSPTPTLVLQRRRPGVRAAASRGSRPGRDGAALRGRLVPRAGLFLLREGRTGTCSASARCHAWAGA